MKTHAIIVALLCMAAAPALADDDILVKQAWSRATPKGAQVAAGYLTIENHGAVADKLISAATPLAKQPDGRFARGDR